MNNKFIIAAAGSGKTTYLISEAMDVINSGNRNVLITTYTENNAEEIKKKIIGKYKYIPSQITIQTWFSFLIQHGVRPYQGTFNDSLKEYQINGMILNNDYQGTFPVVTKYGKVNLPFSEEKNFLKHYFSKSNKIYSDRLPKFVYKADEASDGEVIKRISRIFNYIYIDEVQDLAGYDLDIIGLLFKSDSEVILVGDPRQVTYITHHEKKNSGYLDGKIKEFIQEKYKTRKEIEKVEIDETKLSKSHRNNKQICDFSSKLYKSYVPISPCACQGCRNYNKQHEGIFLINQQDVDDYLKKYNPIQLRWNRTKQINEDYRYYNFGESKGMTFERVLIYPTDPMEEWIKDHNYKLTNEARAKLYVAITRARYSVGIIINHSKNDSDSLNHYFNDELLLGYEIGN
ncbi:hypothetical protein AGMMS49546_18490 [Spirochaetia bacterium]|nr:hypothetical protein AGMMS49546_18490 [Spirochaetia bacterium]